MGELLLVSGGPFSGKTTLAKAIRKMGQRVIDTDDVRKQVYAAQGYDIDNDPRDLWQAWRMNHPCHNIWKELQVHVQEQEYIEGMKYGAPVLVHDPGHVKKLARKDGHSILSYVLRPDPSVFDKRSKEYLIYTRQKHPERDIFRLTSRLVAAMSYYSSKVILPDDLVIDTSKIEPAPLARLVLKRIHVNACITLGADWLKKREEIADGR